jgi:acetoin utilization deacetylase AcuC-like enzyme
VGARTAGGQAGGAVDLLTNGAFARLHPTGKHPERQERLLALDALGPATVERRATAEQLARVHDPAYLELLQAVDRPVQLDADTVCSHTSWEAATLAAGITLEAVDRSGFALVRPPGHHALAARAMGFCLVNNVAVAARYAQAELGIEGVAIVDFDVHHGNGTDELFRGDDSVLVVSLHQWPFWPGSGGPGTSDESTLNVPLPAGSGDTDYLRAFEREVEPAVARFAPGLVLVSAGVDAHVDDPLAEMQVTVDGFTEMARRCASFAPRVAAVLEGGYNLRTLPTLVDAVHRGLAG